MTNKRTIGELIENEVRKQQIPITEFAKMICCQRNNVYDIFKRSKMDIAGQAEMPVHLLKFESWNVKAYA